MRLVHGRAYRALAASGLGLSLAAAAPLAPQSVPGPTAPMSRQASADPAVGAVAKGRLAEIKVELAWLADPATFPCQLAVHATSGVLEIGGQVQGEALHKRVLRLAGDHGQMPVRDKLMVLPGTSPRQTARDRNPQLCREATVTMSRLTAGQPGNYEISADANGQISVSGEVSSCEEKLKVSRHLSQLTGCTSVVNNLVPAKTYRDGKVHTVVSADRRLTLPGEPTDLMPAVQPAPAGVLADSAPETTIPATAAAQAPAKVFLPAAPAKDSPYTSQLQNFTPPANQYGGATAVSAAVPNFQPPPPQPPVIYRPPTVTPTVVAQSSYRGSYSEIPQPQKAPQVAVAPSTPPVKTPPRIVQVAATTPAPATPKTTASPAPQASTKVQANAVPVQKQRPIPPQVAAQVKAGIEKSFHGSVRDVTVVVTKDNQLQIRLRVVHPSEGAAIGKKIMSMPELVPYKVDLQVPLQ